MRGTTADAMTENSTDNILLHTEGLVKSYGRRRVVDGVDINVKRGEVVGLLGPNGAGKTTTFYMTVGLVRPDGGKVFFDGTEVTRVPMHKRARLGIGYLAQEPSVFRKLTVEENILAILEMLPLSDEERKFRLDYLLQELDIEPLRKNRAYTLSGGERRRLEITRALVTAPKLMLLDEPFSGVDPIAVYEVQQIIAGLKRKGLGILVTDHNVRETLSIVDRAYLICEGKVEREGTSEFLSNDPKSRELYLGPRFSM
jgi:lipopolysaccharide export system ATP-binding protein